MTREARGKVFLVGAGPGDPGLFTLRGRELLETCDTVIYDALVNPDILQFAPYQSDRIFVGKRCGRISWKQDEINELMAERARNGERVVRLKGGDPFLFGRGGEEAEFLTRENIAWDIVPGVSSALAVPAAAAIPVTHRGLASSVAIVTAHGTEDAAHVNWQALSTGADTLVVLMGASRLADIAAHMMASGRAAETPAAVIESGTSAHQRVVNAPLGEIASRAAAANIGSPAILVVGAVTALGEQLYDALSTVPGFNRDDRRADWRPESAWTSGGGPRTGTDRSRRNDPPNRTN